MPPPTPATSETQPLLPDSNPRTNYSDPRNNPGPGLTIDNPEDQPDEQPIPPDEEFPSICRLLYTSHFLSTWNSRLFEFGAVLFLIYIYPDTLLPVSIYALARAGAGALLAPGVGRYIDRGDRLRVIRVSIVGQRVAVGVSCGVLFAMASVPMIRREFSDLALGAVSIFACVEKLGSVMNTIAVERDWVVVIAMGDEERLNGLNSRMRRIDLFCKLVGPLVIAFIDGASTEIAIIVTGSMTILSVLVEYFAIARVYRKVPALAVPKDVETSTTEPSRSLLSRMKHALSDTRTYCQHPAFLPSFSLALLYLTVLSFSGQMITYLAALGLRSSFIGILRGVSTVFELSATWVAPLVIGRIGSVRAGIWFINWQILCVAAAGVFFWVNTSAKMKIAGTVVSVIASRVGLWGFDLSVQNIVQEEVEAHLRGTFSSQEFALQNMFEMLAFASTIIFSKPQQFRIPATISAGAVGIAGALFAVFVRGRRGHLLHWSRCIDPEGFKNRDHHHWWMGGPERDVEDVEQSRSEEDDQERSDHLR